MLSTTHVCATPYELLDHHTALSDHWSDRDRMAKLRQLQSKIEGASEQALTWSQRIIQRTLFGSHQLYFLTPSIGGFVHAAATALPSSAVFMPYDLPSPCGFVWLAEKLDLCETSSWLIRGFSWTIIYFRAPRELTGDLLVLEQDPHGPPSDDVEVGWLSLSESNSWIDPKRDKVALVFWLEAKGMKANSAPVPVTVLFSGFNQPIGKVLGKTEELTNPEAAYAKMAYTLAFLLFIQQKVLMPIREFVPRAVRRRLLRRKDNAVPSEILVLKLRETTSLNSNDPAETKEVVDWQCQWMVEGHWRNQWHGPFKPRQPKWIREHHKGPLDKPFRAKGQIIRAVVR